MTDANSAYLPSEFLRGTYQERLANYWADDDGQGFVAFQRKHRFDKNTMKDWQDCVRALFPRKKVGLIPDRSTIRRL